MPGPGGRDYYVITVRGERGPMERGELRRLLAAAEIRNDDQVRNAFGRNLGPVAQVLGANSGHHGAAAVPAAEREQAPARRGVPVVGIIIGLLIAVALVLGLISGPADPGTVGPAIPPVAPVPTADPVKPPPGRPAPTAPTPPKAALPPPASPTPARRPAALPAGWLTASVGSEDSSEPGFDSGTWVVHGRGRDIWGTADQFRFVHATIPEEATLTVRLVSGNGIHNYAKAGIMLRASTDPGSAHVTLSVRPNGGLQVYMRPTSGAVSVHSPGTKQAPSGPLPVWLRLVRRGTTVSAQVSTSGSAWQDAGTLSSLAFTGPLLGGLLVCSVSAKPMTATFDNLALTTP